MTFAASECDLHIVGKGWESADGGVAGHRSAARWP